MLKIATERAECRRIEKLLLDEEAKLRNTTTIIKINNASPLDFSFWPIAAKRTATLDL